MAASGIMAVVAAVAGAATSAALAPKPPKAPRQIQDAKAPDANVYRNRNAQNAAVGGIASTASPGSLLGGAPSTGAATLLGG